MTAPAPTRTRLDDGPEAPSWVGSLAGALGAASALVVIEVLSLFDSTGVSPIEAVGNRFIESFAASLKDVAVELFGTNDKVALQIGTAVVAIAIGALLGRRVERAPNVVLAGFAAFALLGIWASFEDPLASKPLAVVSCLLGATVGVFITIGLDRRWRGLALGADTFVDADEVAAGSAGVDRRQVLVNAGVLSAILVFGVAIGRAARQTARDAATVVSRKLPGAQKLAEVPQDTLDAGPGAVEGITPYITPTDDFYRIDTALRVPIVDAATWSLKITGLVDRELTFTYDELLARDLVEVPITMLCVSNEVGGNLVGTARWVGVPLAELLEEAGVQAGAEQLMGESVDGFTAGFPVDVATDGRDGILALGMNGRTLPSEHGYPARLVIPGIYGYVSATKWISEIRLTTWDEEGFWVPRGWSRLGPIKTSSRIDVPAANASVAAGRQPIAGVAWAPTRGISRVEVQVDDDEWREAALGPVASSDTWVQWHLAWDAEPGDHVIRVRATDGDGETQTGDVARPDPDGATGWDSVGVTVES